MNQWALENQFREQILSSYIEEVSFQNENKTNFRCVTIAHK